MCTRNIICSSTNRLEALQNLLDGKYYIRQGLKNLCEALKDLRCGRKCEAEKNLVEGIRQIKIGLCMIEESLQSLSDLKGCKTLNDDIQEGICKICRGLKDFCDALNDLRCKRECEAEKNLVEGISQVEKGLCKIEKGLENSF